MVFGVYPRGIRKTYQFYESKIPQRERADFLSLVAIELLELRGQQVDTEEIAGAIKTTLERVIKRLFRAAKRQREKETSLASDVPEVSPSQPSNQRDALLAAIDNLELDEVLLVLMRLEGNTLAQIAKTKGVSTSTMHRRWNHVLERLRNQLYPQR